MTLTHTIIDSPVGPLALTAGSQGLTDLRFSDQPPPPGDGSAAGAAHLTAAVAQLREYFAGERRAFDLGLSPVGTDFQREVWRALRGIPFGETRTYAEIAVGIARPKAVRAVGAANGKNPIPIIVPCHRVIGADGALTGFGGGLDVKEALLRHEGWQPRGQPLLPGFDV